ncbi:uncharacterized protein [Callorhinus ursinus]|uniref:uncharacterized protein isoform X1 n=1 Tax=Callorhinus ursinus TaxID=34884 RepID=UPI003CD02A4A
MRRALTCGGVRSPPSAPGGGGAASAALSARAAQRGSTTFVSASLHRALTLGASSGEGSGRDNNTPPPPPPPRRRRPPVVAATHGGRLGSGLGLTTTPGLGPRALCRPQGRAAGRGEAGATGLRLTVGAASVRGWAGGCFRGDRGGGGEFLSLWRWVRALTFFFLRRRREQRWRRSPFLRSPPPSTRRLLVCAAGPGSLLPFPLRFSSGGGRATGLAGWALTSTTPPSRLALSAFPLGPDARPGARTHVTLRESRSFVRNCQNVCTVFHFQLAMNEFLFSTCSPATAKLWKEPKCPSTDEWIKEDVVYIHNGILCSHQKE